MDRNIAEEFEHNGNRVVIWYDEDAGNPFKEFDEYTDFSLFLNRYDLSTGEKFKTQEDFQAFRKANKIAVYVDVFAYIHSGITVRSGERNPFNCPFDSGWAGYAYISRDKVKMMQGDNWKYITKKRREELFKYLYEDVKRLDSYLQGETYGYTIYDENDEIVDSCGGFYGDIEYLKKEVLSY